MKGSLIPSGSEVVREAVVLIAGALLAAFVLSQFPSARDYIKRQLP